MNEKTKTSKIPVNALPSRELPGSWLARKHAPTHARTHARSRRGRRAEPRQGGGAARLPARIRVGLEVCLLGDVTHRCLAVSDFVFVRVKSLRKNESARARQQEEVEGGRDDRSS